MAADVAGVTTFPKAAMEAMRSGEVREATVKFTTLEGLLFGDEWLLGKLWAVLKSLRLPSLLSSRRGATLRFDS